MNKSETLIQFISNSNLLHAKYLKKSMKMIMEDELIQLEDIISFFETQGNSIERQAQAYLLFLSDTMKEQIYFAEHHSYRHTTFEEVANDVYFDDKYMQKYMLGLTLSHYLWNHHLETNRWILSQFKGLKGKKYLEVGPGYGEFFMKAMMETSFQEYIAVDISETSINGTEAFINWNYQNRQKPSYQLIHQDFLEYHDKGKVDGFMAVEVLEHLENPLPILKKILEITCEDAFICLTTVINAPEIDHIYLFRSREEVFQLIHKAGLKVHSHYCTTGNYMTVDQAEQKNAPIMIAVLLKK